MRQPDPIAVWLRRERQRRGWSLEEFERRSGFDAMVVGSWERGDRQPPLWKLRRWCEALGRDLLVAGASFTQAGVEHAVQYPRADVDEGCALIVCDDVGEARAIASQILGSRVLSRRTFATDWAEVPDAD